MTFDVNSLLSQTIAEAGSTQTVPVPAGDHRAYVEKWELKTWAKKDDPTVSGVKLQVIWNIEDQEVRDLLGRDKVLVQQDIMLDLDENGNIALGKGRNVDLNRLREALHMNGGRPFSFSAIDGQYAIISVKHDVDKNDPEKIYPRVKAVGKLA